MAEMQGDGEAGTIPDVEIIYDRTDMAHGFSNDLSTVLNKILDIYGLGSDTRKKSVECQKMLQLLLSWGNKTSKRGIDTFLMGSFYETTTIGGLSSDLDLLNIISNIRVIDDISQWKPNKGIQTYMMDSTKCYRSFVKLYLLSDDIPEPLYADALENVPNCYFVDDHRRLLLKNDKSAFRVSDMMVEHGPALKTSAMGKVKIDVDLVPCLMCDSFPREAANWKERQTPLTRSRIGGDIIDQATHCYLVGVGNKGNVTEHLEWRLSFSDIERKLMHAWNDTLYKCYIMIKFINKDLIEPLLPDLLSSYHFKTILMWMNEEFDKDFFVETNLEGCLLACLQNVLTTVKNRSLPHYFVQGCNLFNNKISEEARDRLVSFLETILSKWPNSLFEIDRRNLGSMLYKSLSSGVRFDDLCDTELQEQECSMFSLPFYRRIPMAEVIKINIIDMDKSPKEICESMLDLVNRSKQHTWDYPSKSKEFLRFILKECLCQFGLNLVQRSKGLNNKQAYCYWKSGYGLLRKYIESCCICTTLRIAEHFTLSESYELALDALEIAETKFVMQMNPNDESSNRSRSEERESEERDLFSRSDYSLPIFFCRDYMPKGLLYQKISADKITDAYHRCELTPTLSCEKYLFYLQFLCFHALGLDDYCQETIDKMVYLKMLQYKESYRTYHNIIGHCYSMLGEEQNAYREYKKALLIWGNHDAALWLLAVLLRNKIHSSQH